ncbi:MAG: hypothetical protein ACJAT4_003214 [Granulosicoccus sp.]|jgi:hypothetical protein
MKKIIWIIFIFASYSASGQDNLTGLWYGKITQEEGGFAPDYTFEIYITQKGNKIIGRSYVYVDEIYASFDISGELNNEIYLELKDSDILDNKVNDGMEWCLKKYQLVFKMKNGIPNLEGFWQGKTSFSTCIPGKVFLKKQVPRA